MPNDDDGQDHMSGFIPLKEVDRSAPFGEVASYATQSVARYDHQILVVDRQKRACSFCAVSEPYTEMSPGLAMTHVDFDSDMERRYQLIKQPFSTLKILKQWLNEVRIFTVSADNVSK